MLDHLTATVHGVCAADSHEGLSAQIEDAAALCFALRSTLGTVGRLPAADQQLLLELVSLLEVRTSGRRLRAPPQGTPAPCAGSPCAAPALDLAPPALQARGVSAFQVKQGGAVEALHSLSAELLQLLDAEQRDAHADCAGYVDFLCQVGTQPAMRGARRGFGQAETAASAASHAASATTSQRRAEPRATPPADLRGLAGHRVPGAGALVRRQGAAPGACPRVAAGRRAAAAGQRARPPHRLPVRPALLRRLQRRAGQAAGVRAGSAALKRPPRMRGT
jgi:hypothetical protein